MDWQLAIERNREALLRLLALWIASLQRFAVDGAVATLPRYVRTNVLRLLRPAEAAARRLIVMRAKNVKVSPPRTSAARSGAFFAELAKKAAGQGNPGRIPAFRLIDPRKRFDQRPRRKGPGPRVWVIGYDDSHLPLCARRPRAAEHKTPPPALPDDPVSAARLCLRLQSLQRALEHLPRQARRMARVIARREQASPGPRRVPPLRPGWPPGYRRKHIHSVDGILYDCHSFAHRAAAQQTRPSFQRAPPSRGSFFA